MTPEQAYGWVVRMATIGEASSTPAIRRIEVPRWVQPGALASALLALLVLTISPAPEHAPSVQPKAAAARLEALPFAVHPLVSRTLGRDQVSYSIHRAASGLAATNRAQGLSARFGAHGVQVRTGRGTLAFRLRAAGYGRNLASRCVGSADSACKPRLLPARAADGVVCERPTRTRTGIHPEGATDRRREWAADASPLALWQPDPSLERGSTSLSFTNSSLRYAGLTAFDARGHRLPARLELRGQTLLIRVGEARARYPLTIDPFVQQAKLTRSSPGGYDGLGDSVAIAGDTIVVGAAGAEHPSATSTRAPPTSSSSRPAAGRMRPRPRS